MGAMKAHPPTLIDTWPKYELCDAPPPPPLPSHITFGGQRGGTPPPPEEGPCFHCSVPLRVTQPVAAVPPPLTTEDAPALGSPGSSTLVKRPKPSVQLLRCFPASSVAVVQLSR